MLIEKLNLIYQYVNTFSKSSPVISGALSLYGLGIITYVFKGIPTKIVQTILNEMQTSLTITSNDPMYYELIHWINLNHNHSFVRDLSFARSGKYQKGPPEISVGYNLVRFFFKRRLFIFHRVILDTKDNSKKEQLFLKVWSRKKELFTELLKFILEENIEVGRNLTEIKEFQYNTQWRTLTTINSRSMESVVSDKKRVIIDHLDAFKASKDHRINAGIPFRTGIMLYGPPGTGKTSLIKAIATKYKSSICILSLRNISDSQFRNALAQVDSRDIVVIEDIDAFAISHSRVNKKVKNPGSDDDDIALTLSGLINAIDGLASGEGRILIATANHPELLDSALTRPGRFDLKVEIGYMTNESMKEYMKIFYPNVKNLDGWNIKKNMTPVFAQDLVFKNPNKPYEVLKQIANKKGA